MQVVQLILEETLMEMPVQKRKETEEEILIREAIVVKDEGSMMVHLHWIQDHWAYNINFFK